jgi:hypothetical protein
MLLWRMSHLLLGFLGLSLLVTAPERRTDGPPGSEFGDFSSWDGQFSLGGKFGASLLSNGDKTSFAVGVDADYRPNDLFGFKLSFDQGLQTPRATLFQMTPFVHTEYSNVKPYALFGPGMAFFTGRGDTKLKFSLAAGVGADFMLRDTLGFGMQWTYVNILDSVDVHTLMTRISYWF